MLTLLGLDYILIIVYRPKRDERDLKRLRGQA